MTATQLSPPWPEAGVHHATPYSGGAEMLTDLLAILDRRLAALVDYVSERELQSGETAFRGFAVSEAQVRSLFADGKEDEWQGFPAGSMWAEVEPRIAATRVMGVPLALDVVRERFRLAPCEMECLVVALSAEADPKYARIYGYLNDDATAKHATAHTMLSLLCPASSSGDYRPLLLGSAPLLRTGVLAVVGDERPNPQLGRGLRAESDITQFVFEDFQLDAQLQPVWLEREFPVIGDSLTAAVDTSQLATALHEYVAPHAQKRDRFVCILSGRAGSGRRGAAEAACRNAGVGMLPVDCRRLLTRKDPEALLSRVFRASLLHAAPPFLGHFEFILNDRDRGPGIRLVLERLMEERGWVLLLSVDERGVGPEWFQRERRVELRFGPTTIGERCGHWMQLLKERAALEEDKARPAADSLAAKFRLTPGQIALAFHRSDSGSDGWLASLHTEAGRIAAPNLGELAQRIQPVYRWEQLVLPARKLDLLRDVTRHVQYRRKVNEEWQFSGGISRRKSLTVLFSGQPGTGKSMAAEVIANELQMDLYRIDLAAVVSKYIGETEKNLSRIFREAEHSDAILFFDEADALFGKRSEVKDAHDRYANIEINYLLQQIESYEGIAILATNLRQHLDEAFLRRVHIAVEFPLPGLEERLKMWRQSFPAKAPLAGDIDFDYLARRFELTGGNIVNIAVSSAFLAADEGAAIGMAHMVRATERELEKTGKRSVKQDFGHYAALLEPQPIAV